MKRVYYLKPIIEVYRVNLEESISAGSGELNPGTPDGGVQIIDWSNPEVVESIDEDSSW